MLKIDISDFKDLYKRMDEVKSKALKNISKEIIETSDKNLRARDTYKGTGKLAKSLYTTYTSDGLEIMSNELYAKIQNEGGKIKITPKMRRYFWAMHYKTKKELWKNMALTKDSYIVIPKQPYLIITQDIVNFAETELEQQFIKLTKNV